MTEEQLGMQIIQCFRCATYHMCVFNMVCLRTCKCDCKPFPSRPALGFNPILQKFGEMICGMIFFKTMCRVLLFFCFSRLINNFVVNNSKFGTLFWRSLQLSSKDLSSITWCFFHDCRTTHLGIIFCFKR